ncbi:MAG: hypothetical protein ABJE66_03735 [Deltaproteobacteria bacterium]
MKKIAIVVVLLLCGIAVADGSGAPAAGAPMAPSPSLEAARQACATAMNADPNFAKSIELTIDKQLDQKTIDAHEDAYHHIQKNENHVIYAYAAMWVLAALLVGFLFLRQQALKSEILALKRDLSRHEEKA